MLPKPTVLESPTKISPIGIGLGACNTDNVCSVDKCDIVKQGISDKDKEQITASVGIITWLIVLCLL
ncbi:MAG: hypothetical protein K6B15_02985 [Parasporobacterium sp.]|nr:hypothetical protein [Parasporobacterium sp.]